MVDSNFFPTEEKEKRKFVSNFLPPTIARENKQTNMSNKKQRYNETLYTGRVMGKSAILNIKQIFFSWLGYCFSSVRISIKRIFSFLFYSQRELNVTQLDDDEALK